LVFLLAERFGPDCWLCRKEIAIAEVSIDHVLPISLGGDSSLENLRLAHLSCNQGRGSRME
jgi:5-methylcytosine-specific restriction endonuclease McrA